MRCENELYNTDDVRLPKVVCYGQAVVVRGTGVYSIRLCSDCANNGGARLVRRALRKWYALGWTKVM